MFAPPKVKVCGVTRAVDVRSCLDAKVDFVGLNIWPGTKRHIDEEKLSEFIRLIRTEGETTKVVVVDVSPDRSKLERLAAEVAPDYFQIIGDWSGETEVAGVPVIRAYSIGSESDLDAAESWSGDLILLDARKDGMYGGTGKQIEPELIAGITRPYFLAGGLTPANVAAAVSLLHPFAVDTASGVESSIAQKDAKLIEAFAKAARNPEDSK